MGGFRCRREDGGREGDGSLDDQEVGVAPAISVLLSSHPSGRKCVCVRINKRLRSLERDAQLSSPLVSFSSSGLRV